MGKLGGSTCDTDTTNDCRLKVASDMTLPSEIDECFKHENFVGKLGTGSGEIGIVIAPVSAVPLQDTYTPVPTSGGSIVEMLNDVLTVGVVTEFKVPLKILAGESGYLLLKIQGGTDAEVSAWHADWTTEKT